MPRFFFHLKSGSKGLSRDGTGLELADAELAFLEDCEAVDAEEPQRSPRADIDRLERSPPAF